MKAATTTAEVYHRAVEGWDEPVFHAGKQVGVRRRYSDALLRMMSLRGTQMPEGPPRERMPIAEVERVLLRRLDCIARHEAKQAEAEKAAARRRGGGGGGADARGGLVPLMRRTAGSSGAAAR